MKRYQCIKDVWDVDYKGRSYITFRAGSLHSTNDEGHMLDNYGTTYLFLKSELEEHFQELEPLDDHYTDHEAEEYTKLTEPIIIPEWARVAIVIIISIIAIILTEIL